MNPWIDQQKMTALTCGCALRCVRMDRKHWKGFIKYQVNKAQSEGVGCTLRCVTQQLILHVRGIWMTQMVEVMVLV